MTFYDNYQPKTVTTPEGIAREYLLLHARLMGEPHMLPNQIHVGDPCVPGHLDAPTVEELKARGIVGIYLTNEAVPVPTETPDF